MVYKIFDGSVLRTPTIRATEVSVNTHFAYQFCIWGFALWLSVGTEWAELLVPCALPWALYWANWYSHD